MNSMKYELNELNMSQHVTSYKTYNCLKLILFKTLFYSIL